MQTVCRAFQFNLINNKVCMYPCSGDRASSFGVLLETIWWSKNSCCFLDSWGKFVTLRLINVALWSEVLYIRSQSKIVYVFIRGKGRNCLIMKDISLINAYSGLQNVHSHVLPFHHIWVIFWHSAELLRLNSKQRAQKLNSACVEKHNANNTTW